MGVKFAVFADLHTEFIHDASKRVETFIKSCRDFNVDFCAELGDFCPPGELKCDEKEKILDMFSEFDINCYHALGNHDMDSNSKQNVLSYLKIPSSHTSFDCKDVHFVVLDTCFCERDGIFEPYSYGNYKSTKPESICIVPQSELTWLKEDLKRTKYPVVIFSHHSLTESRTGIRNVEDFRNIVKESGANVVMCVCGHEHVDRAEYKDGIWYYCINSISYYWAGGDFEHTTYGEEVEKDNPHLRFVFPYHDPLFAIFEIKDNAIFITGRKSSIVGKLPCEMSFEKEGLEDPIEAAIVDRVLPLDGIS